MIEHVLLELGITLGRLSLLSMGHTESVLAQMERDVVGQGWMTQTEFARAYALSQLIPGEGPLFVIAIGYHVAGIAGALTAYLSFFIPTAILAMLSITVWHRVRESPWPQALRLALTPLAVGLSAAAVLSLGRAMVRDLPSLLIVGAATLVLLRTNLPTPVVVLGTALAGAALIRP